MQRDGCVEVGGWEEDEEEDADVATDSLLYSVPSIKKKTISHELLFLYEFDLVNQSHWEIVWHCVVHLCMQCI